MSACERNLGSKHCCAASDSSAGISKRFLAYRYLTPPLLTARRHPRRQSRMATRTQQFVLVLFALAGSASAADESDPFAWNREGTDLFEAGRYAEAAVPLSRAIDAWTAMPGA